MEGKIMCKVTIKFLILSLLLVVTSCGTPITGNNNESNNNNSNNYDRDYIGQGVVFQSESVARATDLNLLANQTNFSAESVERAINFQEIFSEYADNLMEKYPGQISAVWMEPAPNQKGYVQFVGKIPSEEQDINMQGLGSNNIVLSDNGGISIEQHIRRAELTALALADLGYSNTTTFFDPMEQVIQAEVQITEGGKEPSNLEIASALDLQIQAYQAEEQELYLLGAAASVKPLDINITVHRSSEPMIIDDHSRGGNWLRRDGIQNCTSGWSVDGPSGGGVITAGHCKGLNQFEQPGLSPYSTRFIKEVRGIGGDVEYHTTTHYEPDDFYADSRSIRDVVDTKSTYTMIGGAVCFYGRRSNQRTCNHRVEAIGVTITANNVTVTQLARTSSTSSTSGDSGGGWSWGNIAWGVNKGRTLYGKGVFTPIRQAEIILGVTVKR